MSESDTIDMALCCYCSENWVRENSELVCEKCLPQVEVDMAIAEVRAGLEILKKADRPPLTIRYELLKEILEESKVLVETLLPTFHRGNHHPKNCGCSDTIEKE